MELIKYFNVSELEEVGLNDDFISIIVNNHLEQLTQKWCCNGGYLAPHDNAVNDALMALGVVDGETVLINWDNS